ncbi:hypothetical protein VHEMI06148 [[Torrubiella] hemipterigena]|uniref:Haloacid dehalogenase-like hydrolase n=2 Tax=[Torrubiella] hemipterigena TaxID=1531966 RepID=A0A0A1TIR1_9HYPO|nr:hypothetical protein VHEMI06148 [[Torrubiella] hemipterigena]
MTSREVKLPPIRACIFDMDGLLINSEDIITQAINEHLEHYGRPLLTQQIRAQLMGVAGSSDSEWFHNWAKLPISRETSASELRSRMHALFPQCEPLPGARALVANLSHACSIVSGERIQLALASTTKSSSYALKTSRPDTKQLLDCFQSDRRILGDDVRLPPGQAKPHPAIYKIALEALNSSEGLKENPILPSECLVIEDSIPGVEAGRRAGMRVVWVPHPALATEYEAKVDSVLAGRTSMFNIGNDWQLGEIQDGWAESIPSLEKFDSSKYGITVTTE